MEDALETLKVEVHIREHNNSKNLGKLIYLTWYYNGLTAKDLGLRVPNIYHTIRFELDAPSKLKFRFVEPEITRYSIDDTSEYEDLDLNPKVADDYVEVYNQQIHYGPDTVGSITLVVTPIAPGAHEYYEASLKSDPQVTNTNGDFCPHCDENHR